MKGYPIGTVCVITFTHPDWIELLGEIVTVTSEPFIGSVEVCQEIDREYKGERMWGPVRYMRPLEDPDAHKVEEREQEFVQ